MVSLINANLFLKDGPFYEVWATDLRLKKQKKTFVSRIYIYTIYIGLNQSIKLIVKDCLKDLLFT